VAKFAKYLTRMGCNVWVLTRDNSGGKLYSLVDDVTAVKEVIRVKPNSNKLIDSLFKSVSSEVQWIRPMARTAIEITHQYNIDAIVHSAPDRLPLSGCMIINKSTSVPYIVDLRDPLSMKHERDPTSLKSRAYFELTDLLEPRIFRCASAVVLNNDRMHELYAKKYPSQRDKMHVINNGYDPEDYERIEPTQSEGFQIVYPGKFRDDMRWFFEPFARFVDERPDVFFTHFGREDHNKAIDVKSVIQDLDIEDHVSFEGYVERSKVFSATMGADLGLAVGRPGDQLCIPTKMYDYMGCNIPVLAADDGESAMRDILSGFSNAHMVERSDGASIYYTLKQVYNDQPFGLGNPEKTEDFTRDNVSKRLYELVSSQIKKTEYSS
jgi:glycosyltransferase involved in cell wall biosynthesis